MTVNSSANSIILILFAFSDNLFAENSKLSAESGLCGLSLLESMHHDDDDNYDDDDDNNNNGNDDNSDNDSQPNDDSDDFLRHEN